MDRVFWAKVLGAIAAVAGLATVLITSVDWPWKKEEIPSIIIPTQEWIDLRSKNTVYEYQISMFQQDLMECEAELIGRH